jgi:hypothetical protein
MAWAKVAVGDRVAFYGNALGVYRRGLPGPVMAIVPGEDDQPRHIVLLADVTWDGLGVVEARLCELLRLPPPRATRRR